MKARLAAITLMFALLGAFVLAPIGASAAPKAPVAVPVDVVGTLPDGGAFEGVFTITEIVSENGNLFAVGTLTGGATDVPVSWPLAVGESSCDILSLVLGPLHLDVLGLVVDLDQVVLDITAESGTGNLLGNLLCAVSRLLDSNAAGNALANLLNRILGLLG